MPPSTLAGPSVCRALTSVIGRPHGDPDVPPAGETEFWRLSPPLHRSQTSHGPRPQSRPSAHSCVQGLGRRPIRWLVRFGGEAHGRGQSGPQRRARERRAFPGMDLGLLYNLGLRDAGLPGQGHVGPDLGRLPWGLSSAGVTPVSSPS